ncbi:hypothetical protein [Paracraurococcus lichenis]|uniref:XRE family transcriptional regulator n=1 Tax=Paracraurococcus lichenis TaxID=3064888 RepID=A0ABT9EBC3_9PROT|nr:hypothetical protein [Paracraurococcus sp. LOR1-02]MDO9713497.1 hypothetical protein [Paracraurococcus sp. LOR1-02]
MAIRLRTTINTHLEDRGVTKPAAIGVAVGLPATEAASLLGRWQWRAGDIAALQAVARRLGLVEIVPPDSSGPRGKTEASGACLPCLPSAAPGAAPPAPCSQPSLGADRYGG